MSDKILKWQNDMLDSTNYTVTIGDVITQDNIDDILNYKYCGYNSFFNDITRLTEYTDIKYADRGQKFNPDLFPPLYGAVTNGYIPSQNAISDSIGFVPYDAPENMARPYWFVSFIATKNLNIPSGWLRYNTVNFAGNVFFIKEIKGIKKCFISKYTSTNIAGNKITYDYIDRHATLNCTCDRDLTTSITANYLKEDGDSTEYYIYPVLVIVVNNNIYIRTNEIISPANVECYDYRYYKPIGAGLPFKDINSEYLWFETNHGFTEITTTKTFTANGTKGTTLENAEIVPNKIIDDLQIYKYITYNSLLTATNAYDNDDNITGYYNIIYGLYVKDDTTGDIIKPIISGGIVTGWSNDLSANSDIDTWNTSTDHDVPAVPPSINDKIIDDIDDMLLGYDILDNGMIKYYQITVGDLIKVAAVISNMSYSNTIKTVWDTLNDTAETNKLDSILNTLRTWGVSADNLMPSIVSLKSFGISTSNFLATGGTKPESIILNGVDCETNTVRILASSMSYHIGDYTINGKYGDALNPHFLDYSPYTQMEIYIPYCGTVELPSKCMYNTINVYLLGDIFSGSCVGVVKCKGAIVATKSGMIGVDTPLTSNGNGMKSTALMTGVMNSIGIGAQTILSGASGNMGGIISGATAGMSNISQQIQASNENYTRMVGNVSDKCAWALPHQATIKIIHPIPNYGENYERTYGKPVCKSKTLAVGDGFTIVDNPIINGNMTLAEKTEIENYLRSGVIL